MLYLASTRSAVRSFWCTSLMVLMAHGLLPHRLAAAESVAPPAPSPVATIPALTACSLSIAGVISAPSRDTVPGVNNEWLVSTVAEAVPALVEGGAILNDGDLLVGWPISLQAEVFTLASGAFGTLEIPASHLSSVIISAVPTAAPLEVAATFSGAVLANGERISGTPVFLNQAEAGIDNGKRVVVIPRARLTAVVIRAPAMPTKPVVRVRLATGDLVSGTITAQGENWTLRHALGEWLIPQAARRSWWSESPDRVPVSALLPTATYTATMDPPLVPLTINRQARGEWLTLGQLRCDQGLNVRSGTTASVSVPAGAGWKTLVAAVAVNRGGPAVFTVSGDGRVLYTSPPLGARSPLTAIAVPISGVKVVSLSVVNVQVTDSAAVAVWGWPTLIR